MEKQWKFGGKFHWDSFKREKTSYHQKNQVLKDSQFLA